MVIMLCTAARGGMRTVIESYEQSGIYDGWNVKLIYTHDEGGVLKKMQMFIMALKTFVYLLLFKKVALIHNHSAMRGSFWRKNAFSSIARLRKVPVVLHLHGSEMESFYASQTSSGKKCISNILEKADVVVVLSKSWKAFVLQVSPKAKVQIIYNYVSLPDENLLLKHDGGHNQNGPIKILFLGLIGHRKGVYDLINAVRNLCSDEHEFHLYIGGNGEEKKAQQLVDKYQLQNKITLMGWVSGEDKNEQLLKSDIYVLPSYNEGLPMSLLEAMSWGKPVVSTLVGGIPELVRDGRDGYLVKPGDVDGLTKALQKLINDKELRLNCGVNARDRVRVAFSEEVIVPQIEDLYQRVGRWSSL